MLWALMAQAQYVYISYIRAVLALLEWNHWELETRALWHVLRHKYKQICRLWLEYKSPFADTRVIPYFVIKNWQNRFLRIYMLLSFCLGISCSSDSQTDEMIEMETGFP